MPRKKAYRGSAPLEDMGITAIILHGGRVLLLRKIWLPFVLYRGLWLFLSGKREPGESYDTAAYREIREETGIGRRDLLLLGRFGGVAKFHVGSGRRFTDTLYVFASRTARVRLNIENTAYRWASVSDIRREREYTNAFVDKQFIERTIGRALDGGKLAER
ncbi:MAG: NUDIX domain-containing protein [Candidatus Micrarchaeota archaeon]|nr:NUDIX domain-containing protein [Candidatus Micrarchaeota archaeon]